MCESTITQCASRLARPVFRRTRRHDLETITAAVSPVWFDLQSRGEHPAADWIGARINDCTRETAERFNRIGDELDAIEAGSGHITMVSYDEVAAIKEAGPWVALCETCDDPSRGYSPTDLILGYFQTETEAESARARHAAEAGDR